MKTECHRSDPLHERYCLGWQPTDHLPLSFSCLEQWGIKVDALLKMFEHTCMGLDSSAAWGVYHALEHYLADFWDLFDHARSSLPYDPVMQRWIGEASEKNLIATQSEEDEAKRGALTTDEPAPPIQ